MKIIAFITIFTCTSFAAYADTCHIIYGMYHNYAPYEWINEKNKPEGMNIDLLKAVTKAAGCSYEISVTSYSEGLKNLELGNINMLSLSPIHRADSYMAAVPASMVIYRYIFTRKDSFFIRNLDDLRGKTVVVAHDTYSHSSLLEIADDYDITIVTYKTSTIAIKKFSEGEGDAFISTIELVSNSSREAGVTNLRSSGYPIFPAVYGLAMNKNNPALYEKIINGVEKIKQSGEYYEIMKKWQLRHPGPAWYSYAPLVLAVFTAMAAIILIWNKMLHKQVRKKTASLTNLSALFQMVLDSMPECIYLINSEGKISWTNVNNSEKEKYPVENIKKEIAAAIKSSEEFDFTRLSIEARTWKIAGVTIDNDENKLLVIMSDITENVKLRDEALMSARLAAIGEMAATMAHEINNPTALITLNMDFIKRIHNALDIYVDDNPAYFKDFSKYMDEWPVVRKILDSAAHDIDESLNRIKKVILEMKEFGVRKPNVFEDIDIRKPVEDALKFIGFFIKKHTNNFVFNSENNMPKIYGNAFQIEQAVINLVQNACYALTDKNQKIICSLEPAHCGKYIALTILDEGRGIPEEIIEDIWNPFFTTRRDQGGTGLGLAVISRIVKEHKGYHEITSATGEGTVISLYFPAAHTEG